MAESEMKSAYEIALERLEQRGIDRPDDAALSDEARARVGEVRQKSQAALAQLEILHRDRLARLADPDARSQEEDDYRRERQRLEQRCERDIRRIRES